MYVYNVWGLPPCNETLQQNNNPIVDEPPIEKGHITVYSIANSFCWQIMCEWETWQMDVNPPLKS